MHPVYSCPHGHTWSLDPRADDVTQVCPSCGAAALAPDSALTAPPAPQEAATISPSDAAAPPSEPSHSAALSVPGYAVLAELGRGGMGVVYQARHLKLNRLVALKMILAGSHAGTADLARFQTEAQAIARLQHPNIVQVYEVGEHEGKPFFSLEFCGGGSLAQKLGGTPMPPGDAAALVETLARAMHAAHEQKIIHRDLKPANILFAGVGSGESGVGKNSTAHDMLTTPDSQLPTPKITDFGLAKRLDEAGQTHSGAIMGTPSYMAPEQAGGKSDTIGPAADVYALGAVLYECLTGRPPFKAATALDTVLQVATEEPVPPSQLQTRTPRDLETICLKCLHKNPQQRYATAAALADDLHRFQMGEPITARPVGRVERTIKWARRRPAVAALLLVSVLAAGGLLTAMILSNALISSALDEKTEALSDRTQALTDKTQALADLQDEQRKTEEALRREIEGAYIQRVARAHAEWKAGDVASARRLLAACPEELRGWEWHYLDRLCRQELYVFDGAAPVQAVAFAPDGKRVLSIEGTGQPMRLGMDKDFVDPFPGARTLRTWDLKSGTPSTRLEAGLDMVTAAAYTPDGRRVAVVGGKSREPTEIRVLDALSGQPLAYLRNPGKGIKGASSILPITAVAISPDAKQVASAAFLDDILLWDVATGKVNKTLDRTHIPVSGLAFSPEGDRLAMAGIGGVVRIVTLQNPDEEVALDGEGGDGLAVAFSPDGRRLATGHVDRTVRLWDAYTGKLTRICSGHSAPVTTVTFSPNGKIIASATGGMPMSGAPTFGEVKLWDSTTGTETLTRRGHSGGVNGLAFSADGIWLASAGDDKTVRVWQTNRDPEATVFTMRLPQIADLAVSRDGRLVAAACAADMSQLSQSLRGMFNQSGLKLWDGATGKELPPLRGLKGILSWVSPSPDGKKIATVSTAGFSSSTVHIWDARSGKKIVTVPGQLPMFCFPVFSSDGKHLIVSAGKSTTIWDTTTGKAVRELPGAWGMAMFAQCSPDGTLMAWPGKPARVWNVVTGKEVFSFGDGLVAPLSFSRDGRRLAGSDGKTVRVFSTASGKQEQSFAGFAFAFAPNGNQLASGGTDHVIRLMDLATGKEVKSLRGHMGLVVKIGISPDSQYAASASLDRTVRVWDLAAGKELRKFDVGEIIAGDSITFTADFQRFIVAPMHLMKDLSDEVRVRSLKDGGEILAFRLAHAASESDVSSVRKSANGELFGVVSLVSPKRPEFESFGSAEVWDIETGVRVASMPVLSENPSISLAPGGQRLAVTSLSLTKDFKRQFNVDFWDVAGKKKLHSLPVQESQVRALAFRPDGLHLATGDLAGAIKIWTADKEGEVIACHAHDRPITRLSYSPDGKQLGSQDEQGTLKVWDAANHDLVCAIKDAHADFSFSPDGRRVVAASSENLARVWDAGTGKALLTLTGHAAAITRVAFTPDGKRIVTGSADRTVRFWNAVNGLEVFMLRGHTDAIRGLAFDRAGHHLATAAIDGTVKILHAPP
jgi:WD40 repeat protein/serine/threonine protein kinase